MNCKICASIISEPILLDFPTITSDCRPWQYKKSITKCSGCGVIRRVESFSGVYEQYINTPEPPYRTERTLKFILDKHPIKVESSLDIGCGDGTGMKVLERFFPKVDGYDPYTRPELPQDQFDFITLFQTLEHVEDLDGLFSIINKSIKTDGHLLIEVPDPAVWPFDFIIADHIWHFNIFSIMCLLKKYGFRAKYFGNEPHKKLITFLAEKGEGSDINEFTNYIPDHIHGIEYLKNYKTFLDKIDEEVFVYGSAPAAAWVGNILGNKVESYLDDDVTKLGAIFNGKPICAPIVVNPGNGNYRPLPVVAPFPDYQLKMIKELNPQLRFL